MKKILLFLLIGAGTNTAIAQQQLDKALAAKNPVWIQMMDDTATNYLHAVEAFDIYWTTHKKPDGESDMDMLNVTKNKKRFSKKDIREARKEAAMRMKIKKFIWWKNKVEPYVQDDGTITTPYQLNSIKDIK
jgi:hypothetical protein